MLNITAKDIMNPQVITVLADMPVIEIAGMFTAKMISGAPVVDSAGKLLGVVSLSDIVKTSAYTGGALNIRESRKKHEFYEGGWEESLSPEDLEGLQIEEDNGLCAQDIMTPIIICVQESTSLAKMADIMVSGRIHRVIVTRHGKTVGIVTTMDILKTIRDLARQEKNSRIPGILS